MLFRIVLAFAFFVFSLKAYDEEKTNFLEINSKCEVENGLLNDEIREIDPSKPIETDNFNVKCYFRCLLRELYLMDQDGNFILEGLANIKPEYWNYTVQCSRTTGIESCDKALNFENCIWSKKMAAKSK